MKRDEFYGGASRRAIAASLALASVMAFSASAHAQSGPGRPAPLSEASAGEAGAAGGVLEEVVVTATKSNVVTTAQNVPAAITAFNAKGLERLNVRSFEDLGYVAPNVSLRRGGSFLGVANFAIRGQGTVGTIPTTDPLVGTFVDGVYQGTSFGIIVEGYNIDSIEILRGPQGLLFGKNVSAGAVLLRSHRPTVGGQAQLKGRVIVEEAPLYSIAMAGDIPIGDKLAASLTVQYTDDHSWFDNALIPGKKVGASRTFVVRPVVVWQPTDQLRFDLIAEHGRIKGQAPAVQNPSILSGFDVGGNPGFTDLEWNSLTHETNLDVGFGNGRISNVFGARRTTFVSQTDADGTLRQDLHVISGLDARQVSNELRYSGDPLSFVHVTAGGYYFHQSIYYRESRILSNGASRSSFGGEQDTTTLGAFLSGDFRLTQKLTLTLGGRYTKETKDVDYATFSLTAPRCSPIGEGVVHSACSYNFTNKHSVDGFIPKVAIEYRPWEDILLYAYWTKGFRSGGYNFRNTGPAVATGPTNDEEQNSYEVGAKTTWLDGRLRINGAVYLNDVKGMIRESVLADPVLGFVRTFANTADSEIRGIEFDTSWAVTERLRIAASVGWSEGKYTNLLADLSGDGVLNSRDYDLSLPNLPGFSGSINATYDQPIGQVGVLSFNVNYMYKPRVAFTDANTLYLRQGDVVGANVRFEPTSGSYYVMVYGRNLLNENTESSIGATGFGGFRYVDKGRRIGIELGYNF